MHDKNGVPLTVGDRVKLEGEITQSFPGAETCNIVVRHESGECHTLTSTKVEKIEKPA